MSFRCLSSLIYGQAPDVPYWDGVVHLDLLLPDPAPDAPVPAVVYLHGGGWRHGDKAAGMYPWHSPLMAENGFVAVNVGYRLTDLAPFPAQAHDVKAAIRWLRANADEYGIDPARIGVWGDSAGGHLAALLGTSAGVAELEGDSGSPDESSAVQAVIARCAPVDFTVWPDDEEPAENEILTALFGGPPKDAVELRRLASPAAYVHENVPPFLVVHGTEDETVPFGPTEAFVSALRAHGVDVTFEAVDGGHHNLLPDEQAPWGNHPWTELGQRALEFFDERLRRR
jgi:acetyl esterase/lipase